MKTAAKLCRYCGRSMRVSDRGYEENSFCSVCLDERLRKTASAVMRYEVHDGRVVIRGFEIEKEKDVKLYTTNAMICEGCLDAEGEGCNTPGCVFIRTPMSSLKFDGLTLRTLVGQSGFDLEEVEPVVSFSPLRDVLEAMTGVEPPDFVGLGVYFTSQLPEWTKDPLQAWAAQSVRPSWLTGIGLLDAADKQVQEAVDNGNIPGPRLPDVDPDGTYDGDDTAGGEWT